MLTTKNVHFVKLSKCETDFTITFLSLRQSKNIYGTSNESIQWEVLERVLSKCLARSLSALQTMTDTCIALRKIADVYIALSY